jgi:hypothetical protein
MEAIMYFQLFVAATLMAIGYMAFVRFAIDTPFSRRFMKLALYLGVTALLSAYAGAFSAWLWIFGAPGVGLGFHTWWTRKHGIGWLSAEPREKYYALRGWSSR